MSAAASWSVLGPLLGAVGCFLLQRNLPVVVVSALITSAAVLVATANVLGGGETVIALGGWAPPLGIHWQADGLTVLMLMATAAVLLPTCIHGHVRFRAHARGAARPFWPLVLLLWASLNALYLSRDLFNLYVTLEIVTLAAVALVTLEGRVVALRAALRYLLIGSSGALAYLMGVALLYAQHGTLDMDLLAVAVNPDPVNRVAIALITAGLLVKAALFPLHSWLPGAHGNAPAPVSALLSALVVKAGFLVLLRLWFETFPMARTPAADQTLAVLGAVAILWGSALALCQQRIKLLVAYSTVAQVGYLFLVFAFPGSVAAWSGALYHLLAHAFAKAAMFLAAGNVLLAAGHDRHSELAGVGRHLPVTLFAFALAGVSLMGLPPSGGFVAKWLLLEASLAAGYVLHAAVILAGGLLACAYLVPVLQAALLAPVDGTTFRPVPASLEWTALSLALVALVLGLVADAPLAWLAASFPGTRAGP